MKRALPRAARASRTRVAVVLSMIALPLAMTATFCGSFGDEGDAYAQSRGGGAKAQPQPPKAGGGARPQPPRRGAPKGDGGAGAAATPAQELRGGDGGASAAAARNDAFSSSGTLDGGVVEAKSADGGAKVFRFGEVEIEGRLRSPQLVYFLRRVRAEFAAEDLGHRTFMRELSETRKDPNF